MFKRLVGRKGSPDPILNRGCKPVRESGGRASGRRESAGCGGTGENAAKTVVLAIIIARAPSLGAIDRAFNCGYAAGRRRV